MEVSGVINESCSMNFHYGMDLPSQDANDGIHEGLG